MLYLYNIKNIAVMEKYLIHSNELHLIDAEKIHQAVEKMVESLDLARKINHVLGIKEDRYELAEDFGIK